ncbi:MAG: DUF6282 family protein [Candidatus Methylomirabilales bacterium]
MAVVSLAGFCDLHVHTAPAPFRRIGDTIDIARQAAAQGLKAIVVKSHFGDTAVKAYHGAREVEGLRIYSGIVLNRCVGGLNPVAAALALSMGAKVVWMPTLDAANHIRAFGAAGTFGFPAMEAGFARRFADLPGLSVLEGARLRDEAKAIVQLVAEHDAVLATGHLAKEEIWELVAYARALRHPKVLVTHPEFTVPNLSPEEVRRLAREEVFFEFCAVNCFPIPQTVSLQGMRRLLEAAGPERAVLSSDGGQFFNPVPTEILRVVAQGLHEQGVPLPWIEQMACKNPSTLLGL